MLVMPSKITTLPLMNEYVQCLHNITFNVSREINQIFLLISILYPYVFKSLIGSKVLNQKPNCLIDCWVFFFISSVSQKSKYIMPAMSMFSQIRQCLTFQFQHMTYCRPLNFVLEEIIDTFEQKISMKVWQGFVLKYLYFLIIQSPLG